MIYIKNEQRLELNNGSTIASNPEELTYVLTKLVMMYINQHDRNFRTFYDAVGALEVCKQELYRRLVAPYANSKMTEHGDVYDGNV